MENKNPSQPIDIKSPMYRAELDVKTGILTVARDDENGTMPYDIAKEYLKK